MSTNAAPTTLTVGAPAAAGSVGKLTGVIPPVCTPFNEDLTVDVESLRRLVDHLIAGGVSGLFALGSSSEVVFLTRDQRRVVLQTVVDQAAGRVPILAGVIDTTTPRVLEHVADARAIGADGYVLTAPFYTRTHPNEIEQHFRLVKESVGDRPLFAYDLPISVQVKLATGFVLDLAEQGVLAGVKDSSGSDHSIRALVTGRDDRGLQGFSVLTGSEVTVDSAIGYGADGAVPGLGNVDPAGYTALVAKAAAGDAAGARHEQERLIRLFDIVNQGDLSRMGGGSAGIGSFKAALTLLGIFARPLMAPPQIQLNDTELEGVRRCLAGAGLI